MSAINWLEEQLEILVIDDDEVDRIALVSMLHYNGFNINLHQANNGKEGLGWIFKNPLDCIFLAYPMANPDGLTILREIQEKGKTIPVIMLIGHGYEHLADELMEAGAKDYLLKEQLSTDKLSTVLNSVVRLHQAEHIKEDITEKKRSADALWAANEKLSAIIHESPLAIIVADVKGVITSWSDAAERTFGWKAEEVIGKSIPIWSENNTQEFREIELRIRAGGHTNGEVLLGWRKKDGAYIDINCFSAPLYDSQGNISGHILLIDDITERRRSENELLETRQLASQALRVASLGALAAGIAHEINQPLNSIKLISDTMLYLLNGGKKLSDDKVIHKLKEISNQVDRIYGIIKHMRAVIRHEPDSGKTIFDVNQVILKAETLMQYNFEKSNIKLSNSLSEQLPLVRGNWNSLEAVMINLITNAIQALETTDKTAKVITCTTWLEENIIIEISDNGTGIKESYKDSLFEPFTSNKNDQGLGLGLFIVQVLVANMNGQISVRNNEQGGATFRMEIPAT